MRALLKNIFSPKVFFEANGNLERKTKVYRRKIVIQNSAPESYHEFHVRPHKDLEINIANFSSLNNKSNVIAPLHKINGILLAKKL